MKRTVIVRVDYMSDKGKEYFETNVNTNVGGRTKNISLKDSLLDFFKKNVRAKDYEVLDGNDYFCIMGVLSVSLLEFPVYNQFVKVLKGFEKAFVNPDYVYSFIEKKGADK